MYCSSLLTYPVFIDVKRENAASKAFRDADWLEIGGQPWTQPCTLEASRNLILRPISEYTQMYCLFLDSFHYLRQVLTISLTTKVLFLA